MIQNIRFNDETNMLVGLQDSKILVWTYPSVAFVDKDLLPKTILTKDSQLVLLQFDSLGHLFKLLKIEGLIEIRQSRY